MSIALQTINGAVDLNEAIEQEDEKNTWWEALREQVNTIGARDALNRALNQVKPRP